jgi:PTS system ascorbate-specific IIA component
VVSQPPQPLGTLLSAGTVQAQVDVDSWSDAVTHCGGLLIEAGICASSYVQAMVQAVRDLGPYIVVAPGVAMPHARPEQGVVRPGVAIVTLATPVAFGNNANDPVDVVIAFAAVDKIAHLSTLQSIAALLIDEAALSKVRAAASDDELAIALEMTR